MDNSMKTLSILTLIACLLVACDTKVKSQKKIKTDNGYNIITIDSCEYIEVSYALGSRSGYYSITHKGNCKNKIHYGK